MLHYFLLVGLREAYPADEREEYQLCSPMSVRSAKGAELGHHSTREVTGPEGHCLITTGRRNFVSREVSLDLKTYNSVFFQNCLLEYLTNFVWCSLQKALLSSLERKHILAQLGAPHLAKLC